MMRDMYLDLGNTRLKWLSSDGGRQQVLEYDGDGFFGQLDAAWRGLPRPDRVWLASVASAGTEARLADWIADNWQQQPRPLSVQPSACGVSCGYRDPGQLGIDRWMAIIAAYHHHPGGVCVVDCGTATTMDMVDAEGRHLGGYILPGINMMREALLDGTSLAGELQWGSCGDWGDSTASCIDLGIRKSVVSLIEQSVERMQAAGVCDPAVMLTGGASVLLDSCLQLEHECREALVLEGMMRLVQEQER